MTYKYIFFVDQMFKAKKIKKLKIRSLQSGSKWQNTTVTIK